MSQAQAAAEMADIKTSRLNADEYLRNFGEMHPPLGSTAALVEADRCYFCYDAPCTTACPTGIDVAGFIRMIKAGNNFGAARLILQENIIGGSCARVCPTETLCEEACVRNDQDHRPVSIGLLQRHAVDAAMAADKQFFSRLPDTGKRVAIVGAGPASLACAHGLARQGHSVSIYEAREKSGGLNEFGLAAYKMLDDFAHREIEYIVAIGGIDIRYGQRLGDDQPYQPGANRGRCEEQRDHRHPQTAGTAGDSWFFGDDRRDGLSDRDRETNRQRGRGLLLGRQRKPADAARWN